LRKADLGSPAPNQADARSNPRYLGDDRTTQVGLMHSSALGADSSLFQRVRIASLHWRRFGWLMKTSKLDGF
jgi:hypothetical protein